VSDRQLNFEKWNTLLEPKPSDLGRKATPSADSPAAIEKAEPKTVEKTMVEAPQDIENVSEEPAVLSVSALNGLIRDKIEKNFPTVWVQGEISNFKPHTSGHFYFSLKDEKSQISAVMFKGFNNRLKFTPENGMEVIVRGKITVYEPRGSYQVFCETMEPVGAGALQKAFEQLKAKLQKEGLFDAKHKKTLPAFPKHIGVVTSPTGAAIQDILNVLGRRYKAAHVTVIPARVQGDLAAGEIVRGIELANKVGGFDVLIVGRGGGSVEDMWCFNEEKVARAIFASQIPIISAVGHEIDFTIADFVADYRAPTPSAAAEVVAKSASEIGEKILQSERRLMQMMQFKLSDLLTRVNLWQSRLVDPQRRLQDLVIRCDELAQRLLGGWQRTLTERRLRVRILRERVKNPQSLIALKRQKLSNLENTLQRQVKRGLEKRRERLGAAIGILESLSPLQVFQRGYAAVFKGKAIIRRAQDLKVGEALSVQLAEGAIDVKVEGVNPKRSIDGL